MNDFYAKRMKLHTLHYSPMRPLTNKSGQQFPNSKTTPEQRLELAKRYFGGESYKDLAADYGISITRARQIVFQLRHGCVRLCREANQ